jgi:hypothetical protein
MKFRKSKYWSSYWQHPALPDQESKRSKKVSARWYRVISGWLKAHHDLFSLPMTIIRCYEKKRLYALQLKFDQINPVLTIKLSRNFGCIAFVSVGKETWDIIFDRDICPMQLADGDWVCSMNYLAHTNEPATYPMFRYETLEALCEGQMLLPLVNWVNQSLATASCLHLYQMKNGAVTWAILDR